MGDADVAAESAILSSGSTVKSDILKVGHHGSKYSSSLAFLKAASPAVAVYSAGLGNTYGHPAPQTITNLQSVGARILGTDKDGTITITIDANGYKINTSKIAARAPPTPTVVANAAPRGFIAGDRFRYEPNCTWFHGNTDGKDTARSGMHDYCVLQVGP
jgi:hypothetical protein